MVSERRAAPISAVGEACHEQSKTTATSCGGKAETGSVIIIVVAGGGWHDEVSRVHVNQGPAQVSHISTMSIASLARGRSRGIANWRCTVAASHTKDVGRSCFSYRPQIALSLLMCACISVPCRASDYFGTVIFAISGSVTAGMAGMDLLGR